MGLTAKMARAPPAMTRRGAARRMGVAPIARTLCALCALCGSTRAGAASADGVGAAPLPSLARWFAAIIGRGAREGWARLPAGTPPDAPAASTPAAGAISCLPGGERARLCLAQMLLSGATLLICSDRDRATGILHRHQCLGLKGLIPPNIVALAAGAVSYTHLTLPTKA